MTTYPQGEISRYGQQLISGGIVDPHITLISPDGDHIFYLSGPLAPMPGCQAGVALTGTPYGLHPAFNHLDYRGARQDGVTWADTVYDPAEIILDVEASGRTPAETRQVVRELLAALDPKKQCTLSWFTPEYGEWVAKVRLFRAPGEGLMNARHRRMPFRLSLRNDGAFWRGMDCTSTFRFTYDSAVDTFDRADDVTGLGANWTQTYSAGAGVLGIAGNTAYWYESGTGARDCTAVHDSESDTDYQVISIQIARLYEFPFPSTGWIDLIGRVNDAVDTLVIASISAQAVSLSAYVGGVLVWYTGRPLVIAPLIGDVFTFVVGTSSSTPRQFRILRNGYDIFTCTEPGASRLGAAYRGWGMAYHVGAGVGSQVSPAAIHYWSAGDNSTVTQSGWLTFKNRGTETVFPKYLCYGPGTFYIGNGSGPTGAANLISFGPLYAGQISLVDTDPRRRGVIDLSPGQIPGTPSIQEQFSNALSALAYGRDIQPLLTVFASLFGIVPIQGPLYSKLTGRFTRPIPGHLDGVDLEAEQVKVSIAGGNADSKIVGVITPLRRWPQ